MEGLKDAIVARTGLDPAMADMVVDAVVGFLKENPDKFQGLFAEEEGVLGKVKGIFSRG